jgi:hypothetical protein
MPRPQAVLCTITTVSDTGGIVTGVDVAALVRRLVLFEKVIVRSVRLEELPPLIKAFSDRGLRSLLSSGALQFLWGSTFVVTDLSRGGARHLPQSHFSFGIAGLAKPEEDLQRQFSVLQRVSGLKNNQRAAVEETVRKSLVHYPNDFGQLLLNQLDSDLRHNSAALKAGISQQLPKVLPDVDLRSYNFEIKVDEYQPRIFRIETPFAKDFQLPPGEIHRVLQDAVGSVSNLNHRFSEMIQFSALTGFREDEGPILFGKVAGLMAPQNPDAAEGQFKRVLEIADVPEFEPNQRVDIDRLLRVRESDECRAFRDWLSKAGTLGDAEIRDLTRGIRTKLSSLAHSKSGKAMRFLATTGLGLIPPPAGLFLGPASSFVDSFLVEHALKESAVVAFLSDSYPSLFRSP